MKSDSRIVRINFIQQLFLHPGRSILELYLIKKKKNYQKKSFSSNIFSRKHFSIMDSTLSNNCLIWWHKQALIQFPHLGNRILTFFICNLPCLHFYQGREHPISVLKLALQVYSSGHLPFRKTLIPRK